MDKKSTTTQSATANRAPKERGMSFNAEMVRAIFDGRKTQTRRPMRIQPFGDFSGARDNLGYPELKNHVWAGFKSAPDRSPCYYKCPFGKVGDRIWVREKCNVTNVALSEIDASVYYGDDEWLYCLLSNDTAREQAHRMENKKGFTPSIHMPRWASRITLEITNVRVERVRDISEEDAVKEGAPTDIPSFGEGKSCFPRSWFGGLWDSIYNNWDANPWVWVLEFKVVEGE